MIINGAKLAVAPVAHATPLFLPRPEIIYINVLHYSTPPELIYYVQHRLYAPIGAIVNVNNHKIYVCLHDEIMARSRRVTQFDLLPYNYKNIDSYDYEINS